MQGDSGIYVICNQYHVIPIKVGDDIQVRDVKSLAVYDLKIIDVSQQLEQIKMLGDHIS
jgi:hypothetical protein